MYRVYQLVYLLQINTLPRLAKFRVCNYHKLTMFLSSNLVWLLQVKISPTLANFKGGKCL